MARPLKDGLDYFPLDVDIFSDKKIKAIRANYGADGIALYLYLLCEIYREGYFITADDDFIDCAAADLGLTADKIRQLMKFFCKRSLFDDKLFTADTILTAKSVQRRYQEARKGSKREIFVDNKSWLLESFETLGFIKVRPCEDFSEKNPGFSEKNPSFSEKNPTKESKVKENKLKESSGAETAPAAPPPSPKNMRDILTAKYGSSIVEDYERRFAKWNVRKGGAFRGDKYATIQKWIEADGVSPHKSSFDVDEIMNVIIRNREQYTAGEFEIPAASEILDGVRSREYSSTKELIEQIREGKR